MRLAQNVDSLILLNAQEPPSQREHLKAYECPGGQISMKRDEPKKRVQGYEPKARSEEEFISLRNFNYFGEF